MSWARIRCATHRARLSPSRPLIRTDSGAAGANTSFTTVSFASTGPVVPTIGSAANRSKIIFRLGLAYWICVVLVKFIGDGEEYWSLRRGWFPGRRRASLLQFWRAVEGNPRLFHS